MKNSTTFEIDGTSDEHRKACPDDFVVVMNPLLAKKFNLKHWVIVTREVEDEDNKEGSKKKPLRIYALAVPDEKLEMNQIRMDQTLRNALGIPFEAGRHERKDLKFFPLEFDWKQKLRRFITGHLGRRYLFLRVAKPHPPDIEKNICRVPNDAMALMGTTEGNRIFPVSCIEKNTGIYTLKNCSVKAFDLNNAMNEQRIIEEDKDFEKKGWLARYVKTSELLQVKPDIAPIFLDRHIRSELEVEPGDPIKVRRNFPDLFKQQLLEVGIVLTISAVALTGLFPSEFKDNSYKSFLIVALLGSLLFSCLIILFRLRSKVH